MAAHFAVLTLPFSITTTILSKSQRIRFLSLFSAIAIIAFLVYARSKAAWGAALVEAGLIGSVLVIRSKHTKDGPWPSIKQLVGLFFVGAPLALTLAAMTPDSSLARPPILQYLKQGMALESESSEMEQPADETSRVTAPPSSLRTRLGYWRNTVEMIRDHPMAGVGIGNFQIMYPQYADAATTDVAFSLSSIARYPHNDYLNILADLGVVGGILAVVLITAILRTWIAALRRVSDAATLQLFAAIGATIAGFGVLSFFSFPLMKVLPCAVLAGNLASLVQIQQHRTNSGARNALTLRSAPPLSRIGRTAIAVISLGILLANALTASRSITADMWFRKLVNADSSGLPFRVIECAQSVERNNPYRAQTGFYRGKAHIDSGNAAHAVAVLKEYHQHYPYNIGSQLNLATAFFSTGSLS